MKSLKSIIDVFFNKNQEDDSAAITHRREIEILNKETERLRAKKEWLKKDLAKRIKAAATICLIAISLTSCGVSQYAGSIEYKTVTWADSETIHWTSLDSARTGTIRNTEHLPCFVGDTLQLKSYYK